VKETTMKVVSTETIQSECLEIIDEIEATGETFIICKDGNPFVKLIPFKTKKASPAAVRSRRKKKSPKSSQK
jgi:antitoxin (DNA-binding transcriptional repressor) of toxin-antitoxin stability system